jgi:hypothetical protein
VGALLRVTDIVCWKLPGCADATAILIIDRNWPERGSSGSRPEKGECAILNQYFGSLLDLLAVFW